MLRCYDLDHSPENFVALGFGNGKLVVGRVEPDSLSTKWGIWRGMLSRAFYFQFNCTSIQTFPSC